MANGINPELIKIANERFAELEARATYLTRIFGNPVTVADIIDCEQDED